MSTKKKEKDILLHYVDNILANDQERVISRETQTKLINFIHVNKQSIMKASDAKLRLKVYIVLLLPNYNQLVATRKIEKLQHEIDEFQRAMKAAAAKDGQQQQAQDDETKRMMKFERVIRVDAQRTRGDMELFRSSAVISRLIKLLSFYCFKNKINYKQGLNEVFAPFLILENSDALAYLLAKSFVDKFLFNVYSDDEFLSLQCAFRLFEKTLQYHDPKLAHHFEQFELVPELYATSWFITLFSQSVPIHLLFQIWDFLLLEPNERDKRFLHFFIVLAFICSNRQVFLNSHSSDLPILLTSALAYHRRNVTNNEHISVETKEHTNKLLYLTDETVVDMILTRSKILMRETPKSTKDDLYDILFNNTLPIVDYLNDLEQQPCLLIKPLSLLEGCFLHTGLNASQPKFIILDCRSKDQFEKAHLNLLNLYHFDPDILFHPDELEQKIHALKEMIKAKGDLDDKKLVGKLPPSINNKKRAATHFCIISQTNDLELSTNKMRCLGHVNENAAIVILHLLQQELPCVSTLDGDFSDLVNICNDSGESLSNIHSVENKLIAGSVDNYLLKPKQAYSPPPIPIMDLPELSSKTTKTASHRSTGSIFQKFFKKSPTQQQMAVEQAKDYLKHNLSGEDQGDAVANEYTITSWFQRYGITSSSSTLKGNNGTVRIENSISLDDGIVTEDEEEDDDDDEDDNELKWTTFPSEKKNLWVDISLWKSNGHLRCDNLFFFYAIYLKKSLKTNCVLCISPVYILRMMINEDEDSGEFCKVVDKQNLSTITKIKINTKNQLLITFAVGGGISVGNQHKYTFKTTKESKTVLKQIQQFR